MKYASRIPKNREELRFVGKWEQFDLYVVKFYKSESDANFASDTLNKKEYPEPYRVYRAKDFRLAQLFDCSNVRALPL